MQKNNNLRPLFSGVLGFFITVGLFLIAVCFEIRIGMCTTTTLSRSMQESEYRSKAYEEFCQSASKVFDENSIDISYEAIFNQDDIYIAFSNYEKAIYKGEKRNVDVEYAAAQVEDAIYDFIKENNVEIPEMMKEDIKKEIASNSASIGALYVKYIQPQFLADMYNSGQSFKTITLIIGLISVIVTSVMIILLMSMYHRKAKAFNFIIASCLSAAIWNFLTMRAMFNRFMIDDMGIGSMAYKKFLEVYLREIRVPFIVGITLLLLAGLILIYVSSSLRHRKKRRRS